MYVGLILFQTFDGTCVLGQLKQVADKIHLAVKIGNLVSVSTKAPVHIFTSEGRSASLNNLSSEVIIINDAPLNTDISQNPLQTKRNYVSF